MKADPRHPSIQLKKVGRFWSARASDDYRAVAVEYEGGLLWFWIGTHADYDRLLRQGWVRQRDAQASEAMQLGIAFC